VATLQKVENGKVTKVFTRLPMRTGQRGYTHTSWVNGKSGTPIGKWKMNTKPVLLQMEPKGTPFFQIYSDDANKRIIRSADGYRMDVGMHFENQYPGSLGCPAIRRDGKYKTPAENMFDYIKALHPLEPEIDVVVFYNQ